MLVTHALHFLSEVDYIYTLENGRIAEHGTYDYLMERDSEFARLARDFGGHDNAAERKRDEEPEAKEAAEAAEEAAPDVAPAHELDVADVKEKSRRKDDHVKNKLEGRLMVAERRETGSVSWKGKFGVGDWMNHGADRAFMNVVYGEYSKAGKGYVMVPLILVLSVCMVR